MKNLRILAIIYWINIWRIIKAEYSINDFTSLAGDVQKFYMSLGVFIVHDGFDYDLKKGRRLFEIVKSFSRQDRMSQVISFNDLTRVRSENTLYAVMMNDRRNFEFAINATRYNDSSSHSWLFVVSATVNFKCDDPGSEFFTLKMNSRVVALCEGEKILKSYYGVFDNRTEVFDLAEWTMEKKLKFKDERSHHDGLTNMKGIRLKIANKTFDTSLRVVFNIDQFCTHLIEELKTLCNFETEQGPQEIYLGFHDRKTDQWSGLLKAIKDETADIGGSLFSQSNGRMRIVDFVGTLTRSRVRLYAKLPDNPEIRWDAYFRVCTKNSIIAITLSLLIFSAILCLMKCRVSICLLIEHFIKVWGIYTQQGLPVLNRLPRDSIQMVYTSMLIWSLILYLIYSARFISYITVLSPELPFDNYEEFQRDQSYKVATVKFSHSYYLVKFSDDPLLLPLRHRLMKDCQLPITYYHGFLMACKERTALLSNDLLYEGVKNHIPCQLGSVKLDRMQYSSFILTKNNPFTETMSYMIMRLRDYGILKRLKSKYFRNLIEIPNLQPKPIDLKVVLPLIAIWTMGMIIALITLILEMVVFRFLVMFSSFKNQRFSRQRTRKHSKLFIELIQLIVAITRKFCSKLSLKN